MESYNFITLDDISYQGDKLNQEEQFDYMIDFTK